MNVEYSIGTLAAGSFTAGAVVVCAANAAARCSQNGAGPELGLSFATATEKDNGSHSTERPTKLCLEGLDSTKQLGKLPDSEVLSARRNAELLVDELTAPLAAESPKQSSSLALARSSSIERLCDFIAPPRAPGTPSRQHEMLVCKALKTENELLTEVINELHKRRDQPKICIDDREQIEQDDCLATPKSRYDAGAVGLQIKPGKYTFGDPYRDRGQYPRQVWQLNRSDFSCVLCHISFLPSLFVTEFIECSSRA